MGTGALFFDVDGVLVDSLPAHLQVCRDKAREFGLSIAIPDVEEFRAMVSRGIKISPMLDFFQAVGFPPPFLARAVADYDRDFAAQYRPPVFPNTSTTLGQLADDGWTLGIVTSNTDLNIRSILGADLEFFDQRCIFTLDRYENKPPKSWCLTEGARILSEQPNDCWYVGDLPSDEKAATIARFHFVAATYGWGFEYHMVNSAKITQLAELPKVLKEHYFTSGEYDGRRGIAQNTV